MNNKIVGAHIQFFISRLFKVVLLEMNVCKSNGKIIPILSEGMLRLKLVFTICLLIVFAFGSKAQTIDTSTDTSKFIVIAKDTSSTLLPSKDSLESEVIYSASDSIRYDIANNKVMLYGKAKIKYNEITLTAAYIEFDWKSNLVKALPSIDSTGKMFDKPTYTDGEDEYVASSILYNFKTKKGKIEDVITEQNDGFVHGEAVKKDSLNNLYIKGAKYTTCNLEHPDFYISSNRLKVVPKKVVVSGPANLVIEDVPTPLVVPFGIFPLMNKRTSGIIFPEYGERGDLGFFLSHGGYYYAINDYTDIALTGDIYSRGSYQLNLTSQYRVNYHFNGLLNFTYADTRLFNTESNKFDHNKDFKFRWQYNQDSKAHPNTSFSSNVYFGTSKYNSTYAFDVNTVLSNTYTSSISYQIRFPRSPFNLSLSANHDQNTRSRIVNVSAPNINFSMSRVNPFLRKVQSGNRKWYENIGVTYNMSGKNTLSVPDTLLNDPNLFGRMQNGIHHSAQLNTAFNLFKYINITPSANYDEYWYLQTIRKSWGLLPGDSTQGVITDTIQGFSRAFNFQTGISASTRLFGILNFKKGKLKAIRHVITPSIGYQYHPNFSDPSFGYYQSYQYDSAGNTREYSIYEKGIFGGPSAGKYGGISMSLGNNLEAKIFSKKDTVNNESKIKLFDNLGFSTFYNLAVDTLKWSPVSMHGSTTLFDKMNISFSGNFSPYAADTSGHSINTSLWKVQHKLLRITDAHLSFGTSLHSKPLRSRTSPGSSADEINTILNHEDEYVDFNVPWDLNVNYVFSLRKTLLNESDTITYSQSLSVGGNINLTSNWKIAMQTSYDFVNKQFSYTTIEIYRDMHCWEMHVRWIPFGVRQSYSIDINVKSSVLQDLKISKKKDWYNYDY